MMQNSAKQVEGMVRQKMEQKEYILLCLEDTNDWSNATTRRLVMQVCRLTQWNRDSWTWRCSVPCNVTNGHRTLCGRVTLTCSNLPDEFWGSAPSH